MNTRKISGFTLVEILFGLFLASIVFLGLFSFFGDTLQRFVQQEDTLTGVNDLQMLLARLRRDLQLVDGIHQAQSSTAQTGTTFPKEYFHLCHSAQNSDIEFFGFLRQADDSPFPGGSPVSRNLPDNRNTTSLLDSVNYCENALAWVLPEDGHLKFLVLNLRNGADRERVVYYWDSESKSLTRRANGRSVTYARGSLESFSAKPVMEFLVFPGEPDRTAELLKIWVELSLTIRAAQDGGKIRKRTLEFSTRVTPLMLNAACHRLWMK